MSIQNIDIYATIPGVGSWTYSKAEIDAGADKNEKEND